MNKKGSTLLEIIVALMILAIIIPIFLKLFINSRKQQYKRELEEEATRIIYCIMQEIKYNFSLEEFISASDNNYLDKKYYKEFLPDIINNNFLLLESGEDITIDYYNDDGYITVKINLCIDDNNIKIIKERTFIKSEWMEYVN